MSSLVTAWCSSFRLIKLTCEYLTQTVAVGNLCQIVKHVKWDRLNISSRLVSSCFSSQIEIHCEHSRFRVLVDGQQLFDFNHQVTSLRDIDTLWIKGSVTITKLAWRTVDMLTCWSVEQDSSEHILVPDVWYRYWWQTSVSWSCVIFIFRSWNNF